MLNLQLNLQHKQSKKIRCENYAKQYVKPIPKERKESKTKPSAWIGIERGALAKDSWLNAKFLKLNKQHLQKQFHVNIKYK